MLSHHFQSFLYWGKDEPTSQKFAHPAHLEKFPPVESLITKSSSPNKA